MYYGNFFTIKVVTKKIQKSKITKTLHGGLAWRLSFALCITHMQDCFNYSTIFNHFNSADIIVHNKIIKNPAELTEKKKKKKEKTTYPCTWCFSIENKIEARWNLQRGFLGSIFMALLIVTRAASDFFIACWT